MSDLRTRLTALDWRVALPAVLIVLLGGAAAAAVLRSAPEARTAALPAGTTMVGALDHTVSTASSQVGDPVQLHVVEPVALDGQTIVPAGATIHGEVTVVRGGGRIAGAPELSLRFSELETGGETYRIDGAPFHVRGTSDVRESAVEIGGGTVAGGILGGVLGGAGGALKGAVAGAVIGTGVAVATKGDQLTLPVGQKLRIRLSSAVTVTYQPSPRS